MCLNKTYSNCCVHEIIKYYLTCMCISRYRLIEQSNREQYIYNIIYDTVRQMLARDTRKFDTIKRKYIIIISIDAVVYRIINDDVVSELH